MKVGDIIEIVRHDENCQMNLRRVRVRSLKVEATRYRIIGENMHGKNGWDYILPLEPWTEIVREPNNIGWFPFIDDPEFDG